MADLAKLLDAALDYSRRGWSVIPVKAKRKVPLIPWKDFQKRAASEAQIREWWGEWPDANVGIVTGAVSGIVVVDVDPDRGGELAAVLDEDTDLVARTGSGGIHGYFKHPGYDVQNFVGDGVDLRADGGMVVAPPSSHQSGGGYEWLKDGEPGKNLPAWVTRSLSAGAARERIPDDEWTRFLGGVEEGRRHDALVRLVGHYCGKGLAEGETEKLLLGVNELNLPPLEADEVRRAVRDIYAKEREKPESGWLAVATPDQLFGECGLDALGERASPEEFQDTVAKIRSLRASSGLSQIQEALLRDQAMKVWKAAGFQAPGKLWKATTPSDADRVDQSDEVEIPEEIRRQAEELLEDPALLDRACELMTALGLQGEEVSRRMVFLAAVSGHLSDPIHIVVHGESSGGKNTLVWTATRPLPENRVLAVSGLSTHALEYRGGRIEGVLFIDEAEGQRDADYGLRVAMSEGRITRLTVNRSSSGQLVGQELEIEVLASVITTTTATALHAENATRTFDVWIDESEELTARVNAAAAAEAAGETPADVSEELGIFRAAISLLESVGITIPYADRIVSEFPTRPLRSRRDFRRLLALVRAHAGLHQRQRKRDDQDRVVAHIDDYAAVYPLLQAVLAPSMSGLTEKALALCELHQELASTERSLGGWVRRADLEREAHRRDVASPNTVRKWSKRFVELGIWESKRPVGAWEYKAVRGVGSELLPLPRPDDLLRPPPLPPAYQLELGSQERPRDADSLAPTTPTTTAGLAPPASD